MATTNISTGSQDCTMYGVGGNVGVLDFTDTTGNLIGAYCSSSQATMEHRGGVPFNLSSIPADATVTEVRLFIKPDNWSFFDVVPDQYVFQWYGGSAHGNPMDQTDYTRAGFDPTTVFDVHTFDDVVDYWANGGVVVPLSLVNKTGMNVLYTSVVGTDSSGGFGDYIWFRSYEYGTDHAFAPYVIVTYTQTGGARSFATIFG